MNGLEMTLPIEQVSAVDMSDVPKSAQPKQEAVPKKEVAPKKEMLTGVATVPAGTSLRVTLNEGFNSRKQ